MFNTYSLLTKYDLHTKCTILSHMVVNEGINNPVTGDIQHPHIVLLLATFFFLNRSHISTAEAE